MVRKFTRRKNRMPGLPRSGDVIAAEHINELQVALENDDVRINLKADEGKIDILVAQAIAADDTVANAAAAAVDADPRISDLATGLEYQPPFTALDVWPAFNANGGAGSWSALSYADYIGGLDASLSGQISSGDVVKTNLGNASDGATPVYSYAAGNGPVGVLITSGIHGGETLAIYAAMRWFQQFVTSNEPTYRQLRNAFRVTWIPNVNPSQYRASRTNSNNVDIARNFDLLWERYDGGTIGSPTYKGAAAADQPETQIIAGLIDSGAFHHVIDCHNYGSEGDTAQLSPTGPFLLGPRQFDLDTMAQWQHVYADGATWSLINPANTYPMIHNYANYVMRHVQGKLHSTAILFEASANIFGSTSNTYVSQAGMRAYAGLIHAHLTRAMDNGFTQTVTPYPTRLTYYRSNQQNTVTIADGGTLINSTTAAQIRFNHRTPDGFDVPPDITNTAIRDFDVPVHVAPAKLVIECYGTLRTMGVADGRYEIRINAFDTNTPILATDDILTLYPSANPSDSRQTITVTAEPSGGTQPFALAMSKHYDAVSKDTVPSFSVGIRKITGGDSELLTMNVIVSVVPHTEGYYQPRYGTS